VTVFWVFVSVGAVFVAGLVCVVCGGTRGQVFPVDVAGESDEEGVSS